MKDLLVVENISKKFGEHTALNRVDLHVPEGSIYGLLGPNGAGKTTLLRIINQILLPDSGRILLDGRELTPEDVAQIGYLPEERGLYKNMKVGEQALYLARLKGMDKREAVSRLKDWFDKFEITGWWDKKIHELSKGMAQKVQFIVTVLHRPKLLIFDEPFSGFDPLNAQLIKDEILQLRDEGATIIFSTHRMESVEELCEYISLINKSEKVLEGKLSEIKKQYKTYTYEVDIQTSQAGLSGELSRRYHVESVRDAEDGQMHFRIRLEPGQDSGELLDFLNTSGHIVRFAEVIPSANDIFLRTVQNHNVES